MTTNLTSYQNTLKQPWGKIQYDITFAQLNHLKEQDILDFGAGFCLTSRYLAQHNHVLAIDPNPDMLQPSINEKFDKQLGSLDRLQELPSQSFDVITCHNVLEYISSQEHQTYLAGFERLLRPKGQLSLIKHNQVGKVLQSVVFSNDVQTAHHLLNGEDFKSASFHQGKTYTIEELLKKTHLKLDHYLAIRTFYSLQPNHVKTEEGWLEELLDIELAVANLKPYKDISFFQHLWRVKP